MSCHLFLTKQESSLTPLSGHATGVWLICLAAVHSSPLQDGEHTDRQVQELERVLLSSGPMVASSGWCL